MKKISLLVLCAVAFGAFDSGTIIAAQSQSDTPCSAEAKEAHSAVSGTKEKPSGGGGGTSGPKEPIHSGVGSGGGAKEPLPSGAGMGAGGA